MPRPRPIRSEQSEPVSPSPKPVDLLNEADGPTTGNGSDPDTTLLEDARGVLPNFPVDALPPCMVPWLERAAYGAGGMPDHVVVPLLGIASSLIGMARRVCAVTSWAEP
jgi:hypothetical protein